MGSRNCLKFITEYPNGPLLARALQENMTLHDSPNDARRISILKIHRKSLEYCDKENFLAARTSHKIFLSQFNFRTRPKLSTAKMSSENTSHVFTLLDSIEADFEANRLLKADVLAKFFEELMKFENGAAAVKEFTWLFGVGETQNHMVENDDGESKECRKFFLIDFKKSRKFLNNFMTEQD